MQKQADIVVKSIVSPRVRCFGLAHFFAIEACVALSPSCLIDLSID